MTLNIALMLLVLVAALAVFAFSALDDKDTTLGVSLMVFSFTLAILFPSFLPAWVLWIEVAIALLLLVRLIRTLWAYGGHGGELFRDEFMMYFVLAAPWSYGIVAFQMRENLNILIAGTILGIAGTLFVTVLGAGVINFARSVWGYFTWGQKEGPTWIR